jgi:hypothetical protein
MTKHKSIYELKESMTKHNYVSLTAQYLRFTRQVVHHRISTNNEQKKHVEKNHRKLLPFLYLNKQ